jgi:hypothetical protein
LARLNALASRPRSAWLSTSANTSTEIFAIARHLGACFLMRHASRRSERTARSKVFPKRPLRSGQAATVRVTASRLSQILRGSMRLAQQPVIGAVALPSPQGRCLAPETRAGGSMAGPGDRAPRFWIGGGHRLLRSREPRGGRPGSPAGGGVTRRRPDVPSIPRPHRGRPGGSRRRGAPTV